MKDYPIIKFAIVLVAGILSARFIELGILPLISAFILLAAMVLIYKQKKDRFYYQLLVFIFSAILIFSAGNILAGMSKYNFNPVLSSIDKVKNTTVVGQITKIDLKRNEELTFYLAADSIYSEEFFIKDELNILCKIKGNKRDINKLIYNLKPGNSLKVSGFYHKGREERNPGEFDYDAYLKSKEILGILNINDISDLRVTNSKVDHFTNFIYQIRVAIDNQIKKINTPETAALLRGLLLADRGEIDYETKTQFINAGVVHVLAVSGLHVGYIILIFLFLFGRFNLYLRSILTISGLICFMLVTGVPPSVFRATVMSIVLIIAILTNRSTNLINSISIAAVLILVLNPNEIYNPGFQLSFAAVLAIGIILPYMNSLIDNWNIQNKFYRYVILFCAVSLSAQIGTLPFTLFYFNKFSVIALFTNLIVIPMIGVIVASGIISLIISLIIPFIAIYFAAANDLIVSGVLYLIKFSGNLSFSYISITNYTLTDLIIFYLMLTILLYFLPRFETTKSKILLVILIVANTFIYSAADDSELLPDNYLSVFMIDVDQGDSFLI
jgi:competence protein ComEC